jgi:hypothetical protein
MVITAFVTPKKEILGAWVSQENPANKLEFHQNGIGRLYTADQEAKPCHYLVSTKCDEFSGDSSLFVKIIDDEDNVTKCYELKEVDTQNNDVLVLIDMESHKEHLYTKVN